MPDSRPGSGGAITEAARQFRRKLGQKESKAASEMIRHYGAAYQEIKARLDALTAEIAAARRDKQDVSPSWIFERGRLQSLRDAVSQEMAAFAGYANGVITRAQQEAVDGALLHSRQLVMAGLSEEAQVSTTWTTLPDGALKHLIGTLQDGSPLRGLLDKLASEVSAGVEHALVTGLAVGSNPREIARQVRQETGMGLQRALTISRTEILRSDREATRESWEAQEEQQPGGLKVVEKWRWLASMSSRTCPACLAMDGQVFELDVPMGTHPNCRCTMEPVLSSSPFMDMLAGDEPRDTGADWFARQEPDRQDEILGKGAGAAFREGKVRLSDFVGQKETQKWGTTRYTLSLKSALERRHTMPPGLAPGGNAWAGTFTRCAGQPVAAKGLPGHVTIGSEQHPVWVQAGFKHGRDGNELEIAGSLSRKGLDVTLLAEKHIENLPNPDAVIFRNNRSEVWEFKTIGPNADNIAGSVQRSLRDGKDQAPNVLLYFNRDEPINIYRVNYGIEKAYEHDTNRRLKQVGILDRSGNIEFR